MYYIFPEELGTWAARVSLPEAQKLPFCATVSEDIDGFLGRTLELTEYTHEVRLGRGMSGYLPIREIVSVSAVRIRRVLPIIGGGLSPLDGSGWIDLDPTTAADFVNFRTGKVELYTPVWDGYQRFNGKIDSWTYWDCEVTYTTGPFVTAEVLGALTTGDTDIIVSEADAAKFPQQMMANQETLPITIGISATVYYVYADYYGLAWHLVLDRAYEGDGALPGTDIAQEVPNKVKLAAGMMVEDRATYLPNALRQGRKLSVINDTVRRNSSDPVPPEAQMLLSKYRIRSWV